MKTNRPKLSHCLIVDAIGMLSYFIPAFGGAIDVVWAPISGILFFYWFRMRLGAFFAIAEELAPFTDFIPTFTIAYFFLKRKEKNSKEIKK
jgi:hypothetical protein